MKKILPLAAIILFLCAFDKAGKTPPKGSSPFSFKAQPEFRKTPLLFIENKGQLTDTDAGRTAGDVLFYAGDSYAKVYVAKTGLHYQFSKAILPERPGSKPASAEGMPRMQIHRYAVNLKHVIPDP